MRRQPGRMGLAEGLAIVFMPTVSTLFWLTWSVALEQSSTAAWMQPLINGMSCLPVLYCLLKVLAWGSGDLYSACEKLVGKTVTQLIVGYYIGVFFLNVGLLLRQFAENTLLTALPDLEFMISIGWYAAVVGIIVYAGIEAVGRASYIVLPMTVLALATVLLLLLPQYEFLYLTPWRGAGLDQVFIGGLRSMGVNLNILIPAFLAHSFQNLRTVKYSVLYGLGISSICRSLTIAAYIAAFGAAAGQEKLLPFYELARLVYINRFIQRVEALIILLWAIVGILSIAINLYIGLYLLGRLFRLPALKPLIAPVLIIIAELAMLPGEMTGVIDFYYWAEHTLYLVGTAIIPFFLLGVSLLRKRRGKSWRSAGS